MESKDKNFKIKCRGYVQQDENMNDFSIDITIEGLDDLSIALPGSFNIVLKQKDNLQRNE